MRTFYTDIGFSKKPPKPVRDNITCGNVLEFTIEKLTPDTEYTNIVVRARNACGRSQNSEMIASVRTFEADLPEQMKMELIKLRGSRERDVDTKFIQVCVNH